MGGLIKGILAQIQAWFGIYNVQHYGASPGNANNTTFIQNAINAASSTGGGKVVIPPGTWWVDYLRTPSNIELAGAGKSTILKQIASAGADHCVIQNPNVSTGDSNIVIRDMVIDGNKANQTGDNTKYGIYTCTVNGFLVDNVEVRNMDGDGIYIGYSAAYGNTGGPSVKVTVQNCYSHDNARNNVTIANGQNVTITNCDIDGNPSNAHLDIELSSNSDVIANIHVNNCRINQSKAGTNWGINLNSNGFVNATMQDIYLQNIPVWNVGISLTAFNDVRIERCPIISSNNVGIQVLGGTGVKLDKNKITSPSSLGVYVNANSTGTVIDPSDIKIRDNDISGATGQGIQVYKATQLDVSGNAVTNSTQQGIYIGGTCNEYTIARNTCTDTRSSGKTQTYGLYVEAAVQGGLISQNYLLGNLTGPVNMNENLNPNYFGNTDGLTLQSSVYLPVMHKTVSYTADIFDHVILADATSAALTINFPNASGLTGRVYEIKKIDSTANAITVGTGGGSIDGAASKSLTTQYQSIKAISDGTNWFVI